MRVLVTGPESNGTKLLAGLLSRTGAKVIHNSPMYNLLNGRRQPRADEYDAVVVVVRNGYCVTRSLIEAGHVWTGRDKKNLEARARTMQARGLLALLEGLESYENVFFTTYEALVHEAEAFPTLLQQLGLDGAHFSTADVKDANVKHYRPEDSSVFFRDGRESFDRIESLAG